jgi:DNA-binding MarR family transcriptional regulator
LESPFSSVIGDPFTFAAGMVWSSHLDYNLDGEIAMMLDESDDIGLLLGLAWITYTDLLTRRLAARGFPEVKAPDGALFRLLHHHDGLTVNQIASLLEVSKQAASQSIDSMEQRGFATREKSDTDRRERIVRLTDRGKAARNEAIQVARQVETELTDAIGVRAVHGLLTAMRGLVDTYASDGSELVRAASQLRQTKGKTKVERTPGPIPA